MKLTGWLPREPRHSVKSFALFLALGLIGLTACATPAPAEPSDLEHAQQTLIDFFSLLSNGEYAEAVERFADDPDTEFYAAAQQNNAGIDPNDHAVLMEATCTFQLQCLEILNVVSGEQISETEFVFVVEFANPDGTLFVLGPCCGANETEMPPLAQFEYRVEKVSSEFFVNGSPVYVP
jgi:hypothetical protein